MHPFSKVIKQSFQECSTLFSMRRIHIFNSSSKLHRLYHNLKGITPRPACSPSFNNKFYNGMQQSSIFCEASTSSASPSCYSLCDIQRFQKRQYTNRNILNLSERGFWKDRFPDSGKEFEDDLVKSIQTIYAGFDPTADSLHIGNLLVIMALLQCQRAGHRPIILLGGFTSTVGDPSGRNSQRPHLPTEEAASNLARIKQSVLNIFGNHERLFWKNTQKKPLQPVVLLDNNDWLKSMTLQQLLSVLELVNVRELLNNAFVKDRLDRPGVALNAKEFMYQICQAYDWLHLFDKYNCSIQVGGSDQLANIIVGHSFVRDARGKSVTGLTLPLLVTADGQKLGKSVGNSLWLSPDRTTYFDFYQYFLRRSDTEVKKLLYLFTFLLDSEIESLMQRSEEQPEARLAQVSTYFSYCRRSFVRQVATMTSPVLTPRAVLAVVLALGLTTVVRAGAQNLRLDINDTLRNLVEQPRGRCSAEPEDVAKAGSSSAGCNLFSSSVPIGGECHSLLERGPCSANHWVVLDKKTARATCQFQMCPDHQVRVAGGCTRLGKAASDHHCPRTLQLVINEYGEAECVCPQRRIYHSPSGQCYDPYETGPCGDGNILQLVEKEGKVFADCVPSLCSTSGQVPMTSKCELAKVSETTLGDGSYKCYSLSSTGPCLTGFLVMDRTMLDVVCTLNYPYGLFDSLTGGAPCVTGASRDSMQDCRMMVFEPVPDAVMKAIPTVETGDFGDGRVCPTDYVFLEGKCLHTESGH